MPLKSDPTLWFNLPGIVAAYQPIRAPGSLLAIYNQAHGGDNRYKLTLVNGPTWSGANGWQLTGASSQYLSASGGLVGSHPYTLIGLGYPSSTDIRTMQYIGDTGANRFTTLINPQLFAYTGAAVAQTAGGVSTGVWSVLSGVFESTTSRAAYINGGGKATNTTSATMTAATIAIIGARYTTGGSLGGYWNGYIGACAFYGRALSEAEIVSVSRQMLYCNANPDWSVWGVRRKWFYAPAEDAPTGSVKIYPGRQLGGGVSIQPAGRVGL